MSTHPNEIDLMGGVDVVEWGPTEADEIAVLDKMFTPNLFAGTYSLRVGSLAPNTFAAVMNEANKWIGTSGRPNTFTREYANRHGSEFLSVAWCDMFVTYVARHAPAPAVLPKGDRAYTPWHADDFDQAGEGYAGTVDNIVKHAKPGCPLFFDWSGSNSSSAVDHVGWVVRNLGGGRLATLEGNTSDTVALRVRSADVIARVCVPAYVTEIPVTPKPVGTAWPYAKGVLMRRGWLSSNGAKAVQAKLNDLGYRPRLAADGDFGTKTEIGVEWFQRTRHLQIDGVVGPVTWKAMFGS